MSNEKKPHLITEQEIVDATIPYVHEKFASPEEFAKAHRAMMQAWLTGECQFNGFPVARAAAALATELIDVALDHIHDEIERHMTERHT